MRRPLGAASVRGRRAGSSARRCRRSRAQVARRRRAAATAPSGTCAAGSRVRRQPAAVARLVQVAARGRARSARGTRRPGRRRGRGEAGAQHRGARRRAAPATASTSPGMSRSTATRVVVVEVAAEALLVGAARRSAPPSRCGTAPLEKNAQRGRLAAELVLGVVQVGEVLDLGHRQEAGQRRRRARCPRIVCSSSSVSKTRRRAEPALQPAGHAVHPALGAPRPRRRPARSGRSSSSVGQRRVDRLRQGERRRPGVGGAACRRYRRGGRPGRRGASGAITSPRRWSAGGSASTSLGARRATSAPTCS